MHRRRSKESRSQQGGALLTTLVLSLVVSLLLAAAGAVAISYYSRSAREIDYAAAIQAADAGVNWQLREISLDPSDTTRPCQADAPCSGSVAGTPATYTVFITNEDGSSPWVAPNTGILTSDGTYNNVTRRIQIKGSKKSIFDEYAIFSTYSGAGVEVLTFNGTGSIINGNVGSNGAADSDSAAQINGILTLLGGTASGSTSGSNVVTEPTAMNWPTVDEIANATFSGGLSWLRTNNNNGNIKQFAAGNTSLDAAVSANFPTSGSNMYKLRTSNFNSLNNAPAGVTWDDSFANSMEGTKTMIFPAGDYYFEEVDVAGGNSIMIDNRNGPVRIWVNQASSGNVNQDTINANFYYADAAPSKFRLYYNKCQNISVGGNTTYNGGFYAWREGCATNRLPSFNFTGGSTINGSVIGGTITVAGGTIINFPNDGAGGADDYSLWFGFKGNWRETTIAGAGSVFIDGTDN